MDAITLLKNDHRDVEKLFKTFERVGERARKTKADVVDAIISELSVHAQAEEQVMYPAIRAAVPEAEDMVLESLEEHHIVKWVLSELEDMSPDDERFAAKVTVLIENVRHHIDEEEHDLFPRVRAALSRKQLADLGVMLEQAKKTASKRPHPWAADSPTAGAVTGMVSGAMNRAVSGARHLVEGAIVKR